MGSEQNENIVKVDEPRDDINALDGSGSRPSGLACDLNVDSEGSGINKLNKVVTNVHSVPCIYRQDIVRHEKSGAIGIVNEVAGDSDSDSSITDDEDDEDDDDEDDEEDEDGEDEGGDGDANVDGDRSSDGNKGSGIDKNEALLADQVRVLWMDNTEPVQHVNDVKVVDRGFLHGDYVASASDPTGQVGVVVDVSISVDLLAPDGSTIQDVSSRDLKRVREFAIGDYVVLGPWLGRVDDVMDNVTVLTDDGSVCKVAGAEPLRLKPISKSFFDEDEHIPYYPGQRVRATSSSVFKSNRWQAGFWKTNQLEATVTKVTAGSVFIYWIASAGNGPDSSTAPAEEQSPKNLKLLSCFSHANWQVGDWCLVPPTIKQSSSITLDKGLSKLGLYDPINSEVAASQLGNECDVEEVEPEESEENNTSMDIDPVVAPDGNSGNPGNNISTVSSSGGSLASVSKDPVHETWPLHRKKIRKVVIRREKKARKKEENFERALLIVNSRTRVDVAWQDGTIGSGLESTALIPIDSPGDHEFVAEQYVVEKASDDVDNDSEYRGVGVVKSVNAKEKTACVRWLKQVARPEDPREFDKEETVSVYELEGHPDYDYSYGDVVVRLSPVFASAETTSDGEPKLKTESNETENAEMCSELTKQKDGSESEACMGFSDLAWAGNITGLRNGDIEVTWADGMVSTVGPQAIFVVGRDDDDSIAAGSDVSDDAASWETVIDDEMDANENLQEETGLQHATSLNSDAEENLENNNYGRNAALPFPFSAFGFFTKLAIDIFSRGRKNVDPDYPDSRVENEPETEGMLHTFQERDSGDETSSQQSNVFDNGNLHSNRGKEAVHIASDKDVPVSSNSAEILCNLGTQKSEIPTCFEKDSCSFRRFDIAKEPLDHYFLGSNGQINNGRKWLKKVQQDWNILQNNLPDGIYVRVYEDRMDLLRAVIVGAYGTPYQDGLFFFDFHLPLEYPDVPPSAYYHSGGWRINPNLYEEGKVCLSLLNTWTGRGNEVWDPTSSSILQILVSLQGLVLNSRPYFNEAGYDKQVGTAEGEKNSLSYNENTFLLNCKTMMYLMRKTPKMHLDTYFCQKSCRAR
ncbi:probable ubiquitin-conjugating enzyme E2 23 isoform X2 [Mercurialis annua]|uniref:probable ubiquitin-conjugating enzyme E2 23 isoform X2 n=1 Tax=Mercurialis annua TaxID=3986 RepID=UPI00216008E8|nr:probable ubiquitin-conjugating enzyme E2 23 isoform X2 [Mercurialis annua]